MLAKLYIDCAVPGSNRHGTISTNRRALDAASPDDLFLLLPLPSHSSKQQDTMAPINLSMVMSFRQQCPYLQKKSTDTLRQMSTKVSIDGISRLRAKAEKW